MSAAEVEAGPELAEVLGDEVGFNNVSLSDVQLRVSQPWPADQLPPTTASLLTIASRTGLMVAASPDGLLAAKTERVRRTYIPRLQDGEDAVRSLDPDFTLPVQQRVSHVAFSSDESCLIIAAEQGGGLAVYDTNQLGNEAQAALQIGTNNTSVRHLLPNPNPEQSHLVGLVLTNGQLLLADLKSQNLVNNPNGSPVFHENVSAASWSKLGKQIVAGRSDSTAVQIDIQGNVKAEIPRPPQLPQLLQENTRYHNAQAMPITSITWLSTHEFLIVYSPSYSQARDDNELESFYFVAARSAKGQPLVFRKFNGYDICGPFGMKSRNPAHHFVLRLNDWDTAADILILASSVSTDTAILGRFKAGAKNLPENDFVSCVPESDGRKAQLPMNKSGEDTSPLGLAIDFSTREVAPTPIPSDDEFDHSKKPLPAMYALNSDGILNMWWVVYNDAVRHEAFCPGIVHRSGRYAKYRKFTTAIADAPTDDEGRYEGRAGEVEADETEPLDREPGDEMRSAPESSTANASVSNSRPGTATSAAPFATFGSTAFSQPASSQQQQSSFASLGQGGASAFGSSSALGQKSSPWGATSGGNAAQPAFGKSAFGKPSTPGQGTAFGQALTPGQASAFGKPSTPGQGTAFGQPSNPGAGSAFGQPSNPGQTSAFGKPSTPGQGTAFGQPSNPGASSAFGKPSTPGQGTAFGQPSNPGAGSAFGKPSTPGGGSLFGQPSQPASGSGFGQVGQMGGNKSSLFGSGAKNASASPFGQYASSANQQGSASPFATTGNNSGNAFAGFGQGKSTLFKETSSGGSTATLGSGSSAFGSFGQPSGQGSSFAAVSRESTFGGDQSGAGAGESKQGGGLTGLGAGFQLGSGFQGDGSARDDLPKPKTGDNLFGGAFGASLDATSSEKPIKTEPGTEKQPSVHDIPAKADTGMGEDAPLPPDPSTNKASKVPDDAPLPPDPSTFKAPKMPDDLPGMPGFGAAKQEEKDVPIAGSPPVNVTNSQTFSPTEGSGEDGPPEDDEDDDLDEDGSDENEEESGEEHDEDEDEQSDEEEEWDEDDEDDEDGEHTLEDPVEAFSRYMRPRSPKSPEAQPNSKKESRTPQSDEKTEKSSYTPAGMPKGPVFPPPTNKGQQSPRSPSPQRAVTSPVRGRGIPETSLPSQIKTSAVPPAKPVPRPAAPPKPREKTAGELEDEAIARVEALLAAPIEPSKDFPSFYTHTDYTGAVDNTGIGGQIERVFRDVNSMIHTVGLNARSLKSFLDGQEVLRKPGERTIDDLDDPNAGCLGDLSGLTKLLQNIEKQLQDGKLEDVREKLSSLKEEEEVVTKLEAKTKDMRKQILYHTDPTQKAMREALPLSAETQAQQTELRQGVQKVQSLLSDVEQQMSLLRADLASLSSKDGQKKNGAPVPTVEACSNTIARMTAMAQQRSADVDFLEAQIKRLPNGIASLRLADDYEDDLAARLAGNRLLTDRNSPAATPPRRPRMAANGDPLGMSGMFGTSRFQTPPSGRRSMRFTPDASGLGRSTGSLGASTRKKMSEVTAEEVDMYQSRVQRRETVLAALKAKVGTRGAKIVTPE